jgi:flagellar FliL protein
MADEEEKETAEGEEPKKKKKPLMLIIIAVVVLVVVGVVLKLVVFAPAPDEGADAAVPETVVDPNAPPVPRVKSATPGPMIAYNGFTVNLADPGGQRYLVTDISIELSLEEEFPIEVAAKEPQIRDAILAVLASKTFDEISTTQGKVALKQEILRRLNTLMASGRVEDVYITKFTTQ